MQRKYPLVTKSWNIFGLKRLFLLFWASTCPKSTGRELLAFRRIPRAPFHFSSSFHPLINFNKILAQFWWKFSHLKFISLFISTRTWITVYTLAPESQENITISTMTEFFVDLKEIQLVPWRYLMYFSVGRIVGHFKRKNPWTFFFLFIFKKV